MNWDSCQTFGHCEVPLRALVCSAAHFLELIQILHQSKYLLHPPPPHSTVHCVITSTEF